MRRPDPRHPSGRCSTCVGLPTLCVCRVCGIEDRIYSQGRCWRCTLAGTFDTLTADGVVDLDRLRSTLINSQRPRAVLRWLRTEFASETIGALASGDLALTHSAIDELGDNLAVGRLRAVLVTAGLLAARDETITRLEQWAARQIERIDSPADRQLIEAFATWWVLRRARNRAGEELDDSAGARRQIARAIELLEFLHHHQRTLAECTQADIDLWLTGPPARRAARAFVVWAHQRRLCAKLTIANRVQGWPTRQLAYAEQQQIVTRLLTDTTINLVDRVVGLLVGCYGQTPARLARLTTADITTGPTAVMIRFGRSDVELVEPIGSFVAALVETRRGRAATDDTATSRWLFPGGLPGRHLDPETIAARLRHLGISAAKLRTDVLLDLGADIPPAILADLIGLYPETAARWTHAAGGDWTHYVAARNSNARMKPNDQVGSL